MTLSFKNSSTNSAGVEGSSANNSSPLEPSGALNSKLTWLQVSSLLAIGFGAMTGLLAENETGCRSACASCLA